jgi:hypothetical protein
VKIKLDTVGAVPMHPDFAMLRAGLAAAQATTPTALAAHVVRAPVELQDALYALFAEGDAHDATTAMHGSFNASAAAQLDRQER